MNKMKHWICFCGFKPIIQPISQSNNQYFPYGIISINYYLVFLFSGWFLKMSCYLNNIRRSTQIICVDFISDNQEFILSLPEDEVLLFLLMAFKLTFLPQTWSVSYIYLVWILLLPESSPRQSSFAAIWKAHRFCLWCINELTAPYQSGATAT